MVLLSKTPPSEMQEQLVQEHSQLDYICGNPLSLYDLNRASVSSAFLTVVLARSAFGDCGDAKSADCEATHMAFAIRQHCPNARVLVRLNHSAFQEDLNERWISTAVSCTLRCSLVALNTLHPGAGTVLSSLLSAAPSHKEWFAEQRQLEFTHGLEFELYPCTVPASAAGLTLRQFQLDLRQYHMTYVALYCTSSGSKQLLGVPPETTLHAGDCVWLMARSWQEVASLDQKYSSRGSEELILQDKAVPRLQDVRPSAALTRGAPTAGLPVPSRKEQLLPLQLASQVLATAVDQMVELASSDPGGRVQAIATQLEQLRADLPELPQQNPEAPTFDVVVCALSYESWMLELVDALREAAANPSLSVQLLLSELPPAHVMVGISARRVVVHNADFGSMAGIQQTNVAQAKRVIVATSSESDSAQIHVLASRISELLLKSGLEGQHLTVDVNSATMEEVVFLRHDPWCDHSRDPVTLPSMSDCANLGNKIFATQLSGENTEPIYSKLSYEYASGCLHAPWVLDTFLAHSIVQPSLVTLLSALIGIQDWCGSSVGEDDDWQEDLEKVSNNQRIQRVLIPDQHVTVYTSYGTLFNACWCLYNVVPLGMFRKASHSCSADQGYVFINPPNDAEVNRGDHLYVVAPIGFSFPLEAPTLF